MARSLLRIVAAFSVALPLLAYVAYPALAMLHRAQNGHVSEARAALTHGFEVHPPRKTTGFEALAADPTARKAIWGTFKLAVLTVLGGAAWGVGLAMLWWRREFPCRRAFALLGYAPLLLPPLVGTLAFYRLLDESGLLPRTLGLLTPFQRVLALHVYSFGVFTYAFAAAALENLDPSHEEAARSLGGGRWAVFRHAVWPAIRAPVAAAGLLVFMAAGASFSGPYLLDTNGFYLTVEIYKENASGDLTYAAALTAVLLGLSLAALGPFIYYQRKGGLGASGAGLKGGGGRALPLANQDETLFRVALSLLAAAILLAPPLLIALGAFTDPEHAEQWYTHALPANPSLAAFRTLSGEHGAALARSLAYGGIAGLVCVGTALVLGFALRRAPGWAGLPAEACVTLAVALPGTAIAIALLAAFHAGSWLTLSTPLGGTAAILVLAYAVRCLPLAVRPVRASLEGLSGETEQAARGLGASFSRTLLRVILPLMLPTLLAAFLVVFLTSAGEFVASEILYRPDTMPVSVKMNEVFRNNKPLATALGVCLMCACGAAVVLAGWFQARARWMARAPRK